MFYETDRLYLRKLSQKDTEALSEINSSPLVMEFFPDISSYEDTSRFIEICQQHYDRYGFGIYAIELIDKFELIGFCGLKEIDITIPTLSNSPKPIFEIKWRISHKHWGKGYAPEAAKKVLDLAFNDLKLPQVIAFTSKLNHKSIRVMEKIGMKHSPIDNFKLDDVDEDMKPHVVFKLDLTDFS